MPDYHDPVRMVRAIREHVRSTGHVVQAADDPLRQMVGYLCPDCEVFWVIGLLALKSMSAVGEEADLLRVATTGSLARGRLTAYLNKRGAEVPGLSRYRRPWVI